MNQPDEFAEFQTTEIVYHDDVDDYSTNEPTMDGTADAILMMALRSGTPDQQLKRLQADEADARFLHDKGAISVSRLIRVE